ncbi:hypothetical protein HaLaN_07818 [Haematococcus lacustris]|uniref:Uncharacterized protein n=1 Tax=Haematococcus lacustris TaxID=44745 RepID=A0A699YQL1_HAELA|nr:hypothetical protein HaLaN_07818 [Haematococcus lacustris]
MAERPVAKVKAKVKGLPLTSQPRKSAGPDVAPSSPVTHPATALMQPGSYTANSLRAWAQQSPISQTQQG